MTDPTVPDPFAALDEMLTAAGVEADDMPTTGPWGSGVAGTLAVDPPEAGAALLAVAPPVPVAAPAVTHAPPSLAPGVADAGAEQRRALTTKALQAAHHAIDVIAETFAARGADFDDAVKALPILHRVLEHVEKLEAAQKIGTAQPPAILTIVLDDNVPQEPPPRKRARTTALDVTDVDPH